jgi:hypothetical protein
VASTCENFNEPSGFKKDVKFFDQINHYQLLKRVIFLGGRYLPSSLHCVRSAGCATTLLNDTVSITEVVYNVTQ